MGPGRPGAYPPGRPRSPYGQGLVVDISARTLLLRGARSDLLSPETARAMTERGPHARLVEFAGVGHAPTLVVPDQVGTVTGFLLE